MPMSAFFMDLLRHMVDGDASDIYLTQGITPMFRIQGEVLPYGEQVLSGDDTQTIAASIMNDRQKKIFEEKHEMNLASSSPTWAGSG